MNLLRFTFLLLALASGLTLPATAQRGGAPNAASAAQPVVKVFVANFSGSPVNTRRIMADGTSATLGALPASEPGDAPVVLNSRPGMRWVFIGPNGRVVGQYTVTRAPNQRYVIGAPAAPGGSAVIDPPPARRPAAPPAIGRDPGPGGGGAPAAAQAFLQIHNTARAQVGVAPLQWSGELAAFAQQWADRLASLPSARALQSPHRPQSPGGPGENFGGGTGAYGPADAARAWLSERDSYRYGPINPADGTGHYTQMVWRDTTHVGYGMARSADGWTYVIANYGPAGNVLGQAPY